MSARSVPPRTLIMIAIPSAVARDTLVEATRTRYGHRYRVLATSGHQDTIQALLELAAQGSVPALIVSELLLHDGSGIQMLAQSTDWEPDVRRVLLAPVGESETVAVALAAGQVDRHVPTPLGNPEETLFPVLDNLLLC